MPNKKVSKEECKLCEISEKSWKQQAPTTGYPPAGLVQMSCLGCCVRLVLSAHPDRKLAQAMLASIAATDGAPARADVLAAVAERLKGQ